MKILKRIFFIVVSTLTILSLFSCGVYNIKKDNSKQKEVVHETTAAMSYGIDSGFSRSSAKVSAVADILSEDSFAETGEGDRKLVKSVNLNTETKTFDASIDWLKKYVSSYNGIIDNSYIDTGDASSSNYKKNAYFAVRIPANKLDSFLSKIGDNLNITFKQENIVDVTEDYFDSESRLKSLKIEEENLNEMLKKAKSVDEMIKVEDKLSEVRSNIENINRRIKNYDKQINYSKVDISITEVKDLTDTKVKADDFSKETLNKKMLKTIEDVKLFLKKLAAYIFINIPWIILFLIVILIEIIIYMIIKSIFGGKKELDNKNSSVDDFFTEDNDKSNNKENKKDNSDKKSDSNKKEKSNDEEVFNKVIEEVNKVVMGESDTSNNADDNSDVEIEFFNEEK